MYVALALANTSTALFLSSTLKQAQADVYYSCEENNRALSLVFPSDCRLTSGQVFLEAEHALLPGSNNRSFFFYSLQDLSSQNRSVL